MWCGYIEGINIFWHTYKSWRVKLIQLLINLWFKLTQTSNFRDVNCDIKLVQTKCISLCMCLTLKTREREREKYKEMHEKLTKGKIYKRVLCDYGDVKKTHTCYTIGWKVDSFCLW